MSSTTSCMPEQVKFLLVLRRGDTASVGDFSCSDVAVGDTVKDEMAPAFKCPKWTLNQYMNPARSKGFLLSMPQGILWYPWHKWHRAYFSNCIRNFLKIYVFSYQLIHIIYSAHSNCFIAISISNNWDYFTEVFVDRETHLHTRLKGDTFKRWNIF